MQIQINQDKKELKTHGTYEFPLMISHEHLLSYEQNSFFWHWHPEIEFTLVLDGDMVYQVENQTYQLKKGEGLFCNSNRLHTGHRLTSEDCVYMALTFNPQIIYGFEASAIQNKYVTPITVNGQLSSIHLTEDEDWQKVILNRLAYVHELSLSPTETYELDIQMALLMIWQQIFTHTSPDSKNAPAFIREQERLHDMLSYIHDHYQEKLTLEQMASHVNICKSECCRFFKRHMDESIFDYLMHYRIKQSLPLLMQTAKSVTDIAADTGFSNPCYFTKIFKEYIGCTPREYRKGVDPS